jgi:hypothetical protein
LATRTWPKAGFSRGDLHDCLLDVFFDSIPETGFASADLAQGQLATLLVQLFEAVKAVAGVPHHLACLRNAAQQLAELQQPHFVLDDFFFGAHLTSSSAPIARV